MLNEYGPGGTIAPDTFAVLEVHTSNDPYDTPWGNSRLGFYGVPGTPTTWFDGTLECVGAYTNNLLMYNWYMDQYTARRAVPTDVTIDIGAQLVGGQTYNIVVNVCIECAGTGNAMRIYVVQVLDHYPSWPIEQRNTVMYGAPTQDVTLAPGECQTIQQVVTFDAASWANRQNIKIIAWAQKVTAFPVQPPVPVYQAAVIGWPFPPPKPPGDINSDGLVNDADTLLFLGVLLGTETNPDYINRSDLNRDCLADGVDIKLMVDALLNQ